VVAAALGGAAAAVAWLDHAVAGDPFAQALLYRIRLVSVRRQAAVDRHLICSSLAASLEGPYLSVDRGRENPSGAGAIAHPDRAAVCDCSEIEAAMAYAEQVTREKRHALERLMGATARGHAASLSPDVASIFKTAAARAGTTRPAEVG
jgi:hypothetical protein